MECSVENVILRGIFHVQYSSVMFSSTFHVISRKLGLLFGQCRTIAGFKPPDRCFRNLMRYQSVTTSQIISNTVYQILIKVLPHQKALIHIADTKQPHLIQKSFYISTYKLWQLYL